MDVKANRKCALRGLTDSIGVYALCDLDKKPIYIGQSKDGIRARVSRHLTSARSDVIANRQLDIWEICEVWAWPVDDKGVIDDLETYLINHYNAESPLVNGKLPAQSDIVPVLPGKEVVAILPEEERAARLDSSRRLPRQMEHLTALFSHILEVKNNSEQRRMLRVHFNRAEAYYERFMADSGEDEL
jgi:hypothetical protein